MYGEEKEYKYFMKDNEMYRVSLEQDEWPDDPRDWDCNVGEMCVDVRGYNLGDRQDVGSYDLKAEMIQAAGITVDQMIKYIKNGNCKGYWIEYDRHERVWKFGGGFFDEIIDWDDESSFQGSYFYDDAIEALTIQDIINISKGEIVALNLYVYNHSGLSMDYRSFIGRLPHAEWDSGCSGLIWTTLSKVKEVTGQNFKTKKKWQEYAEKELEREVKIYNQYLEMDCYVYTEEKFEAEDYGWVETDSCGGYYPEKPYHYEDILAEVYGANFKFYDSPEEAKEAAESGTMVA